MKRLLFGALLMSVAALPAMAALQEGDSAPQFKAEASLAGKDFTFSLKKALRKGPVVVYFYPSAYTGGCDIEAHTFAVDSEKFATAGATIIGVSLDSIKRLNDFSADPKYCAGKFPTASDKGGAISKSYKIDVHQGPAGLKDVRGVEIGHSFADRTDLRHRPGRKDRDGDQPGAHFRPSMSRRLSRWCSRMQAKT